MSTVLFWRRIFEEKKPRSIWERLRHLLSLLLQLAFVALLVGALAEPFLRSEIIDARRVVLVIDNSGSMNATDVMPNRLARAREMGQRFIDGLRFRAGNTALAIDGHVGSSRDLDLEFTRR